MCEIKKSPFSDGCGCYEARSAAGNFGHKSDTEVGMNYRKEKALAYFYVRA